LRSLCFIDIDETRKARTPCCWRRFSTLSPAGVTCFPNSVLLPARRRPRARLSGLPGKTLPVAHHLDQRRSTQKLERPLLSVLPLPVGSTAVIRPHPPPGSDLVSGPDGRNGRRRHSPAQERPFDSRGQLSARSAVAAFPYQFHAGVALSADLTAGTATPRRQRRFRSLCLFSNISDEDLKRAWDASNLEYSL